jgi:hypothetical protein
MRTENTLGNCSLGETEEKNLLFAISKAMCKKHKRTIMLSWDCSELDNFKFGSVLVKQDSPFQIVKNNTLISPTHITKDIDFKKKLKSNIKNHIPENTYNFLLMKATEDQKGGIFQRILQSSAYELLELLCETMSYDEEVNKFFIKIEQDSVKFYS